MQPFDTLWFVDQNYDMKKRWNVLAMSVVILAAIGLRVWDFPSQYELRGVDEVQYTQGSLELLEGITPAFKYAPAGPETWLGWGYAASRAATYLVRPTTEEHAVPIQVRPFVAVNHALFDLYRDLSGIRRFIVGVSVLLSILAIAAAFAIGTRSAGTVGGVLLAGLFAFAPMMIDFAEQARSFSMAWSFAIISVYFAVCRSGRTALWGSAVFLGLAISQRIDMLAIVPMVCLELAYSWREVRARQSHPDLPGNQGTTEKVKALLLFAGVTCVITLLVAPWLITNLIGNLRTIATVRFSPPPVPIPWTSALAEFSIQQGLGTVSVLFIVGTILGITSRRLQRPLICVFALLLLPGVLKSTGHGIGHSAASILPMFIAAPLAIFAISKSSRALWAMVALSLAFPLVMSIRAVKSQHGGYIPDDATEWVESHVPSGTIVMINPIFHDPLPTPERADALWQEEMNNDAAVKKFRAGLSRFLLPDSEVPRALSEENMIVERVERRGWYILGSRSWLPDRRYDIHIYGQSMVFGATNPLPEFRKIGGVLIWRGAPLEGLGDPIAKWVNGAGFGTYIYCSDDVRPHIIQ